jgi:hypothetical protein
MEKMYGQATADDAKWIADDVKWIGDDAEWKKSAPSAVYRPRGYSSR